MLTFIECKAKAEKWLDGNLEFDGILNNLRAYNNALGKPFSLIFSNNKGISVAVNPWDESNDKGCIRLSTKEIARYIGNQDVSDRNQKVTIHVSKNTFIRYDFKDMTHMLYINGRLEFSTAMNKNDYKGNEEMNFLYDKIKEGNESNTLVADFESLKKELKDLERKYALEGDYILSAPLQIVYDKAVKDAAKYQSYKDAYNDAKKALPLSGI